MPAAFAGRRRVSAASGRPKRIEVPAAEVRAEWRPRWVDRNRWPAMEEDAPKVGLLAVVRARVAERPALACQHIGIAVGSDEGYPDLHIWGPGGMAWWELKGTAGRVYVHQVEVIERLRAAGGVALFVWPEDLYCGWVDDELDRLAGIVPPPPPAALVPGWRRCGCHVDAEHTCPTWGGGGRWPPTSS